MKNMLLLFFLVTLAFSTVVPHVGPVESHIPLTYKVQIDDPPTVRWAPIIKTFN